MYATIRDQLRSVAYAVVLHHRSFTMVGNLRFIRITGIVKHKLYHEHGLAVLNVSTPLEYIKVICRLEKVITGISMDFIGQFVEHPKHGKQFEAEKVKVNKPYSIDGIKKFLESFENVGPKTADKIANHFGEDIFKVLEQRPDELLNVPGIPLKTLEGIITALKDEKINFEILSITQRFNINFSLARKIHEAYGDDAIDIVSKNPYRIVEDIDRVGFRTADMIALNMGLERDGSFRIEAGIQFVLNDFSQKEGHCYLTEDQILQETTKCLELQEPEKIRRCLDALAGENKIKKESLEQASGKGTFQAYYLNAHYVNEICLSDRIRKMIGQPITVDTERVSSLIDSYCEKNDGKPLSPDQRSVVAGIAGKSFSVLSGGPGVGKTTIIKALAEVLQAMNKKVCLAAPTGRAAQRMSDEVVGTDAKTIHRLLEVDPSTGSFKRHEKNPLDLDFLIVDECSMLGLSLTTSLLRAIPEGAQVLLIGDPDQLPPIPAGNVLYDLLQCQNVPIFRLTKAYRQHEESMIIRLAQLINKGTVPLIKSEHLQPQLWTDKNVGCIFVEDPSSDVVARLCTETIPEHFGDGMEIQVLTPQNIGPLGTRNLNKLLQEKRNPESERVPQIKCEAGKIYRLGDRVMQTRNDYEKDVYNGATGQIIKIDSQSGDCQIQFDNSTPVVYTKDDLTEDVCLAYAITIHKSQGSEFDIVILIVAPQHFWIGRNLIYTALTRAKTLCVFVGSKEALSKAINQSNHRRRQTTLTALVNRK